MAELINKAYKVRLYPLPEQEVQFSKTFGCARWV
ncbi:MAG: helix-turn-helix domain-containing protein [Firmicutes bacterium]|nr:helix-turn-helix domain-containing protein [Bacillota bacterium]